MAHASGNPTWVDYPSTSTMITAGTLENIENRLDALAVDRAFARYYSGAATVFNFGATRQRIPFGNALETHADVTASSGNTIFTLNRAGVWRLETGARLSASTANQTKYLNISDSANMLSGGYAEVQELRATSGAALSVSTTRRFAAGAVVCATLLVLGNGSATIASDIPEVTFISFTWVRS